MGYKSVQAELAIYLIGKAERCLHAAQQLLDCGDLETAANRAYYTVFNSMRAVHALDNFDSNYHDTIISKFRERYVKTKVFTVEYSDIITDVMELRTACDYQDYYLPIEDYTASQVDNARTFFKTIKEYVVQRVQDNN